MKKEKLEIGQIVNTFGIKGFVKIYPYVDDITRFDDLKTVYISTKKQETKLEIEEIKYQKNMVLAKFKGIDTVENAEKLRNSYVKIDRKDAIKLEEGQYFIADLLGLDVFLDTGEKLGILDDIFNNGSTDIYVVKNELGKQFLLPYIDEVIKNIDLENEKITLLNPENGKEEDVYIYTSNETLEKLHNQGIYENIYKMNKLDFYNLYSGQKVQLNGDKCELYNGEIDIKSDDAWYKLDDLYGVLRDNENTNFVVQKITDDKIYLTHENGSGSIYTYKELYPDFCVGDIVKRVNGKYIK